MKFIGQYIQDLIARFRNDVYLEDISTGTIASGANLGLDSNNKIVKNTVSGGTTDLTSDVTGVLPIANGGTNSNSAANARTALGVDAAGTDNSTNVTLAGSLDYITLSGQEITRNAIDLAADVSGFLPIANGGTGAVNAAGARTSLALGNVENKSSATIRGEIVAANIPTSDLYAYQYLNWEVNTNSFTSTNYELPAANGGFGSDSFTINSGVARDTAIDGTVTMSLASNLQQQGWFVPHACKLVAVSGSFRNNGNEVNPRDVAIFVGTPDIGTSNPSTYTQRLFAAGDDDGGTSNSKIYKVNTVLGTPFSLSAGDLIMPAVCNSTGSSTVSMQGNFNIIIGTPIFTI